MLYIATPSGPEVKAAMRKGLLGCMTTPAQGNLLPDGCSIAADNGKFGKSWRGTDHWWAWLTKTVDRYGPERFLFAVAPDVPFDPALTLAESRPWLARIRKLGIPVAFAAQNGSEAPGLIPWDEIDVLFLGGGPECLTCSYVRPPHDRDQKTCPTCGAWLTEWKESNAAGQLAAEALARDKKAHMGRGNTFGRLKIAQRFGCHTVDGTTLAFGARKNLPQLLEWLRLLKARGVQNALL